MGVLMRSTCVPALVAMFPLSLPVGGQLMTSHFPAHIGASAAGVSTVVHLVVVGDPFAVGCALFAHISRIRRRCAHDASIRGA